ncbi:MAG: class Ib ribonucleoside-diphosphate reductase assembly flavoprotein NrdI [Intestinibaculum porci]|uniref:class Ib ribonucleoside-diphosphate reductase assembly flavoprotein NrdI n=1 Tax=Intestinibaculum porci TaxID=2487118 RepID=UPI003F100FCF
MKVVFASRTGNVESIVNKLGVDDLMQIESGNEEVHEDYILFTYTDGYGDVPVEVDDFLSGNAEHLKGVVVSGDTSYGEAYGGAGDAIAKQYNVPLLYKVENEGTDEDIAEMKKVIA